MYALFLGRAGGGHGHARRRSCVSEKIQGSAGGDRHEAGEGRAARRGLGGVQAEGAMVHAM
jgi:hypothetical protein